MTIEIYRRIPEEELELMTREIELCRDTGGDDEYESYLSEYVAAKIYTEIEVQFATYKKSNLYHVFVVNSELRYTEHGHSQSQKSFFWALRYAIISLGAAKIEPSGDW